ncbi:MAG: phoR [Frankiales bacterium]|nr:phoR [Frankiales bacterium]
MPVLRATRRWTAGEQGVPPRCSAPRSPLPAPTVRHVDLLPAVVVALVAAVAGLVAGLSLRRPAPPEPLPVREPTPGLPGARDVLQALPLAVLVVDVSHDVLLANRAANQLGLVQGGVLAALPQLRRLVDDTRRTGAPHETEVQAPVAQAGRSPAVFRARLAAVGDGTVAVLLEDVTEARRVEAVRRDFVANVSHELKTPVGAMSLLAEAMVDASEDPVAVRRFGSRVQREAQRLGRLVQEIVDLSRLQGADPLPDPVRVPLDRVVAEAVDRARTVAAARGIEVVRGGDRGLTVLGSEQQLVTALANLLDNAVHYSPDGTRVAVAVRCADDAVEVSVSDQGIGIAEADLERVFERFYRADPARSRATGGTGLGLAIVKHVATNHGGEVTVWSVEGSGSTFTLRLPVAPAHAVQEEP